MIIRSILFCLNILASSILLIPLSTVITKLYSSLIMSNTFDVLRPYPSIKRLGISKSTFPPIDSITLNIMNVDVIPSTS